MRLGNFSVTVTKDDNPAYQPPANYNPNGWLNIGHLTSLGLPRDPQEALEYLNALADAVDIAILTISDIQLDNIRNITDQH